MTWFDIVVLPIVSYNDTTLIGIHSQSFNFYSAKVSLWLNQSSVYNKDSVIKWEYYKTYPCVINETLHQFKYNVTFR